MKKTIARIWSAITCAALLLLFFASTACAADQSSGFAGSVAVAGDTFFVISSDHTLVGWDIRMMNPMHRSRL